MPFSRSHDPELHDAESHDPVQMDDFSKRDDTRQAYHLLELQ